MDKTRTFLPNLQLCSAIIYAMGFASCLILLFGLLFLAAYLLKLALDTISMFLHELVSIYMSGDSLVKLLLLILIGFCLFKFVRFAYVRIRGRNL